MGFNSYFYRKKKCCNLENITTNEWDYVIDDLDSYSNKLINELRLYADNHGCSLKECVFTAIQEFLNNHYDTQGKLLAYFRKFYFLNEFLSYKGAWYAKDMELSKDACIALCDKAKECLDECNSADIDEIDSICKSYFYIEGNNYSQCMYLFDKIKLLFNTMNDAINNTDWDNEVIVYRADW